MMTCVSERSGMASSGVRDIDTTPHAATITVATSTRKRLAIDQRMTEAIMSASLQARGRGLEARLGVDEELAGNHDLLPGRHALANLGHSIRLGADLDIDRREPLLAVKIGVRD